MTEKLDSLDRQALKLIKEMTQSRERLKELASLITHQGADHEDVLPDWVHVGDGVLAQIFYDRNQNGMEHSEKISAYMDNDRYELTLSTSSRPRVSEKHPTLEDAEAEHQFEIQKWKRNRQGDLQYEQYGSSPNTGFYQTKNIAFAEVGIQRIAREYFKLSA